MAYYIKLGTISGSVTTKGYEGWMAVSSIDMGAMRNLSMQSGSGGESRHRGTPSLSDFSVARDVDFASTAVMRACYNLKRKPMEECFIVEIEAGDPVQEKCKWTLVEALLSNYSIAITADGAVESFSVNFTALHFDYTQYDPKTGKPDTKRAAYNVLTSTVE